MAGLGHGRALYTCMSRSPKKHRLRNHSWPNTGNQIRRAERFHIRTFFELTPERTSRLLARVDRSLPSLSLKCLHTDHDRAMSLGSGNCLGSSVAGVGLFIENHIWQVCSSADPLMSRFSCSFRYFISFLNIKIVMHDVQCALFMHASFFCIFASQCQGRCL